MALAPADMNLLSSGINIANMKRQGLFQAEPQGIGGQQKDTIAQLEGFTDDLFDFGRGKNIRDGANFRRFYNLNPIPVALEHVPPEKLQAVSIDLDGAPGVGSPPVDRNKFPVVPELTGRGSSQNDPGYGGRTGNRHQWFFDFCPEA